MINLKVILIVLLSFVIVLAVTGFLYQTISTKIDDRNYPPPGKMIDVGGYKMHLNCAGEGGPTVILEAGLGGSSLDWSLVQPEIAKFTTVCSYDRAGLGWSEKSPNPRTIKHMAEEMHALLTNANVPKPYILIGHSLGGVIVRQYTHRYPDEVFGVILVDSSHELQNKKMPPPPELNFFDKTLNHLVPLLAPFGYPRLVKQVPVKDLSPFPEPIQEAYLAKLSTTKSYLTTTNEVKNFDESLSQFENENGNLRNKPLIVISAGKSLTGMSEEPELDQFPVDLLKQIDAVWAELQKNLVSKSENGKQVIAKDSGHMIPWHQPQIIVEAALEEVLDFLSKTQ